ncbi:NEDD8-conjugating enzyme Ubc12 [Conglomerata obtusa]
MFSIFEYKKSSPAIQMPIFADFRLRKELESIELPPNSQLHAVTPVLPNTHITYEYKVFIETGLYKDREFIFQIHINDEYPFKAPKIRCLTPIFHPNIENECVCMNIVREDWSSAFGLQIIILGIYRLFFDYTGENALNVEAGEMIKNDISMFEKKAKEIPR